MANLRVKVLDGEDPVVDAKIVIGEFATMTTDSDGKASMNVDGGLMIIASICIVTGMNIRGTFGPCLIKAGSGFSLNISSPAPV